MTDFSPREIVSELDRFIIGQRDAKRAVAIALRNRWRRMQLDERMREEVLPKNILMIGPTGAGEMDDKEIEIEVQQSGGGFPMFEIPGMPGAQMGAISIGDIFGKMGGGRTRTRRVTVQESHEILVNEESDRLLDQDQLTQEAIRAVESNGIVFLDEID